MINGWFATIAPPAQVRRKGKQAATHLPYCLTELYPDENMKRQVLTTAKPSPSAMEAGW